MQGNFDYVIELINRADSFGFRELANGTRLYGYVPHVGIEAWLHQTHASLSEAEVISLEENLGRTVPSGLRSFFLSFSNGLHLFSGSLSVYGKRSSYSRTGDEARQPFCVVTANTSDRPAQAKPWQMIVGSYRSDGSLVSIDERDGSIFRTKRRSAKILNRWVDISTFLNHEMTRLIELFDSQGRALSQGSTAPPVTPSRPSE